MALAGFSVPHLGQVIVSMVSTPFCKLAMRLMAQSKLNGIFVGRPASKPGSYTISRRRKEKSSNEGKSVRSHQQKL
jgi:hypothetical protein